MEEFWLAAVGATPSRWEGLLLPLLSRTCACHAMFIPAVLVGQLPNLGFQSHGLVTGVIFPLP